MHAERRRPVRLDDPAQVLVDAGLIDVDFVSAQLGVRLDDPEEAARAVIRADDVSPHPLFESSWLGRRNSWSRSGLHPVVWYVTGRRRRNRLSPHPLVEPRVILAAHPEARFHDYGPLSYWLSLARPETRLPCRTLPVRVSWARYRAAAIASAQAWRDESVRRRPTPAPPISAPPPLRTDGPAVTVVMSAQDAALRVRESVASLQAQTVQDWDLVAVDRGSLDDTAQVLTGLAAFDERITVVREPRCAVGRSFNVGVAHGSGEHVAFLSPGRIWTPEHLSHLLGHSLASGGALVQAGAGPVARSREELLAGRAVDLTTSMVRRDALAEVAGFDESLAGAVEQDMVLRLSRAHPPESVDLPIVRRPDASPSAAGEDWNSYVLERQLVDWDAVAGRRGDDALTSFVLPLSPEPRRTIEWFSAVPGPGVELVAVGTRLRRAHRILADAVSRVVPGVRFVPVISDVNVSAATNIGISHARGATLVLARPAVTPLRRPVAAVLAETVSDPDVAVVQPLVVGLDGTILSAGARFEPGHPYPGILLAGHPVSDALRVGPCTIGAPASPLIAVRSSTAASLHGLNSRFRSIFAETDLGLRAYAAGLGRSVLVPEVVITSRVGFTDPGDLIGSLDSLRCEPVTPPPDTSAALMARAGFEVTDHRNRRISVDLDDRNADAILVPHLVVRAVNGIRESPPRLRWAIDIAAPAAPRGDRWGDTYFARSLEEALERAGQHVAVDRRDARDRDSRDHDDVLLVLRGLDRVPPRPGLLNIQWIISHPDMVTPEEISGFDAVYAASLSWSAHVSREWGKEVVPLLQCTDSRWFHPDRAEPDTGPQLVFVGNSRGVYRFAVRSALAIGAPLTLHGTDWAEFVPAQRIASSRVANEDVGALYASAGVVLNDHHLDMRRDSFASNRLFDAAACGARIVSDPIAGLQEIFGGLVQPFRNETELSRLVEPPYDAFPDASTRREIAHGILAEHTFDKRAETLVEDAVRRLIARGR